MKSDRLIELLEKAAKALEDGSDPFHTSFLSENQVTLDECYDLSLAISSAIDLMLIPLRRTQVTRDLKKALNRGKR